MTVNLLLSVIVGQPPSNGVCSRHRPKLRKRKQ